ncbi:hypothetical protein HK105_202625 [Polyrhizophydium stewartii]|uniref:Uncharacterized protein n=1 Tax=Polyrhizophydium stewartii TaxID=2732419 RepID=A0ABR4NE02_9FUNG|nr:hypothetical protein HK105_002383 [Polyrhizophydium stewartii]
MKPALALLLSAAAVAAAPLGVATPTPAAQPLTNPAPKSHSGEAWAEFIVKEVDRDGTIKKYVVDDVQRDGSTIHLHDESHGHTGKPVDIDISDVDVDITFDKAKAHSVKHYDAIGNFGPGPDQPIDQYEIKIGD